MFARFEIFDNAWNAIVEKPFFGHGFGASSHNIIREKFIIYHYHNMYLSVFFYGGLVGIILFLLMIILFLVRNFRCSSKGWYSVVVMALVAFVVDGNHFITYPSAELYVFLLPIMVSIAIKVQSNLRSE